MLLHSYLFLGLVALPCLARRSLVRETLNVTWEVGSPDGNPREMVFINGMMPGPVLVFDEGDDVEITVNNFLPYNNSMHWHGMNQKGTPWADGVPGLTQKNIPPGGSYVYKFKADPAGMYWYHSHSRSIVEDGQFGGLFVRRKPGTLSPFSQISNNYGDVEKMEAAARDPIIVMLSEWSFLTSEEYYQAQVDTGMDLFCVDSVLINGKGSVFCPGLEFLNDLIGPRLGPVLNGTGLTDKGCIAGDIFNIQGSYMNQTDPSKIPPGMNTPCVPTNGTREVFQVDPENEWVSVNFVGSQGLKVLVASIDEHPMWVYEADGQYIEPVLYDTITLYNGQRYSAMIKLDKKPGNYTIRIADNGGDQLISAFATFSYLGGEDIGNTTAFINYGGTLLSPNYTEVDLQNFAPFNLPPPSTAAQSIHFTEIKRLGATYLWTLNGRELYDASRDSEYPLLFDINNLNAFDENLVIRTLNGTWVDLVIQTVFDGTTTPFQPPHPIHKHSNKGYLIGSALGSFTWPSVEAAMQDTPDSFNFVNPPFRDTFVTTPAGQGWLVIRYQSVNPGPYFLHCHIATHKDAGMSMVLLDGADVWPHVPQEYLAAS